MAPRIFNESEFYARFALDLKSAQALVLIQSPFLAERRLQKLEGLITQCAQRRVRICAFVQKPRGDNSAVLEIAGLLTALGVHVSFRERVHEKVAIIDEHILWDGSLNILSHSDSSERMTRWLDRRLVKDAMARHNLRCTECSPKDSPAVQLGKSIAARRRCLRLPQLALSEKARVAQAVISRIENGDFSTSAANLFSICQVLGLNLKAVPWHFSPSLNEWLDG
jgi:hypothetical protein